MYTYNPASLSFFRPLSSTLCVYNNNTIIIIGPMFYASHYTRVHMGTTAVVVLSRLVLLLRTYLFETTTETDLSDRWKS